MESILKEEKFDLNTRIETKINWQTPPATVEVTDARKRFEDQVKAFANFFNEKLGETILDALKQL